MAIKDINTREGIKRMKEIREDVERTLLKYNHNTEAAIAAGACIQAAKKLLSLYPDARRAELTEAALITLADFKEVPPEEEPRIIAPTRRQRRPF